MRIPIVLLIVALFSSCAHARPIPNAPHNGAPAVVFDIDGTLTPRRLEFLEVRPDAAKAVHIFAKKGYKIIYLSARSEVNEKATFDWLKRKGFPDGSLHLGESVADARNPVEFKKRILLGFLARGWKLEFAYGDQSTDFKAYAAVKIPKQRVFALQRVD